MSHSRSPPPERSGSPGVGPFSQIQYPNTTDGYEKSAKIGFNCWKSVIKGTDHEVAIKLHNIDPSFEKEKMKAELAALKTITSQHPGLVKAHTCFFHDNVLWVVCDVRPWSEGNVKDLMVLSTPGGLEETLIRAIISQIIAPLEHMHKHGRIFRDLKAKNILVLPDGQVALQTFTLPSILQDKAPMYRDSLYWVAPEILPNQDTKPSGPAVDIWALGITMIELAIGSPPLASMDLNPTQILQTIAEGSAPSLSAEQKAKFSKAFLDIIDLCLVKNPAKRATIEQIKDHPWIRNATMKAEYVHENLLSKLPEFSDRLKVFLAAGPKPPADQQQQHQQQQPQFQQNGGHISASLHSSQTGAQIAANTLATGSAPATLSSAVPSGTASPTAVAATPQPGSAHHTPQNSTPASSHPSSPTMGSESRTLSDSKELKLPQSSKPIPAPSRLQPPKHKQSQHGDSDGDDVDDQIEQVELEESDGSEDDMDDAMHDDGGEEPDDSDDESVGSYADEPTPPATLRGRPSTSFGTSPQPQMMAMMQQQLQLQHQQVQQQQQNAHHSSAARAASPPHAHPGGSTAPSSLTRPISMTGSLAVSSSGNQISRAGESSPQSPTGGIPTQSTGPQQKQQPQQPPTATNGTASSAPATSTVAVGGGGEVRGRFRIVPTQQGSGVNSPVAGTAVAPISTDATLVIDQQTVAIKPNPNPSAHAISLSGAISPPLANGQSPDEIQVAMAPQAGSSDSKRVLARQVQQTPVFNVPVESYLAENDREYIVFVRSIPGTVIKARLEGRTLILAGALPPLVAPGSIKTLTMLDKINTGFERRIRFAGDIDPNEPIREYIKEHHTLVFRIRKFPKVLDLGEEVF